MFEKLELLNQIQNGDQLLLLKQRDELNWISLFSTLFKLVTCPTVDWDRVPSRLVGIVANDHNNIWTAYYDSNRK